MKREGRVIKLDKNKATVQLMKHAACGDCGACHLGEENMNITIEAINDIGADLDDRVEVIMETPNVLMAAFIGYGIPLISLLIGILGGNKLLEVMNISGNTEVYSLVIGLLLLFTTYFIIKSNEHNFKNSGKYISKIIKVIN